MPLTFNINQLLHASSPALGSVIPSRKHVLRTPNGKVFQAEWNAQNKHLKETFLEKVARTVFFPINNLIARLVLQSTQAPASRVAETNNQFQSKWAEGRWLRTHFTPTPIEATTPDKVVLKGTFFKNVRAPENAPTVILFQPNNALSKEDTYDWLLTEAALQEFPYHFVCFDYRGTGESKGTPHSKKDLFLDGDTIFQYVRDKLHIPENEIHFYGWSLGGGVASNVKNPESLSRFVNERSFNSIDNVVTNILKDNRLARNETLNTILHNKTLNTIIAKFAGFWTSFLNWNMESTKAIEKFKGKTLVVHHPRDEMMKGEASLYRSLFQRATAPPPRVSEHNLERFFSFPDDIHGLPLEYFGSTNGDDNAGHEVAKFLFGSNLSCQKRMLERFEAAPSEFKNRVFAKIAACEQHGGLYWGSGADQFYNRNGLTMSDATRVNAIVSEKMSPSNSPSMR
jgi:hypothetical protein